MFRKKAASLEELLFVACSQENVELVADCLQKGADASRICSSGRTPLGLTAEIGNTTIIKQLMGFKTGDTFEISSTPSTSSNMGYFVVVHSESNDNFSENTANNERPGPFRTKGIDFDEFNDALIHKIPGIPDRGSIYDCPDLLPDLEWDSEIDDNDGSFCLEEDNDPWAANYFWYASILSQTGALLDQETVLNGIDGQDQFGFTALHYAVAAGHLPIIRLLLDAGCNINIEDADNFTPLHLAAAKQRSDVLDLLLSKGANPHRPNTDGITALHVSASRGLLENVHSLITAGANINDLDISDRTPLYLAVSRRQHSVVRYLIEKGAKVNIEQIHGYTPLFEAVCANDIELVEMLLANGAKLTQSHHLLHYAILHGHDAMVHALVRAGSIFNVRNESGDTPLMLAVRTQSLPLVTLLLNNGAAVHGVNHVTRLTPLLDAISHVNQDCVRFTRVFSLFEEFGWNWQEEKNALSHAITSNNDHAVMTLVRRCDIVTDQLIPERSEMMNLLLLRDNKLLVELFVFAGFNLRGFRCCAALQPLSSWFKSLTSEPLSLCQLARITVRSSLKRNIYHKVDKLPLPLRLKAYLLLEDIECRCQLL